MDDSKHEKKSAKIWTWKMNPITNKQVVFVFFFPDNMMIFYDFQDFGWKLRVFWKNPYFPVLIPYLTRTKPVFFDFPKNPGF